jgi:hypothetical protein
MKMKDFILRSGGQTGVDRAVLDFALSKRISYVGWCPSGGRAEDFTTAPGLLAKYERLMETPSRDPRQRTAWNVRDSHASLIILNGTDVGGSRGTAFTIDCATLIFLRPCYLVDAASIDGAQKTRDWINRVSDSVGSGGPILLNVAGPRESECKGIYTIALRFLSSVLL